jgi:hypothetical protein
MPVDVDDRVVDVDENPTRESRQQRGALRPRSDTLSRLSDRWIEA